MFDDAIEFARDLIRIPSPSGGEKQVAARVLEELRTLGFDESWSDSVGNVIGRIRGRGEGPSLMLCSHLDVVDIGDPEDWEYPPYGAVVDNGFLHGRGAMDIKGPLAIQTYAAAHFTENRPEGDLIVAHTVYEERGGWGIRNLLDEGIVEPEIIIIGEATDGDICIGHRGRAELVIEIRGVAGHASAPERARNPIDALETLVPTLQRFAEKLPEDPTLGPSTATPTRIETRPGSNNVIPERALVTLDWRVLPEMTAAHAIATLEEELRENAELPDGTELHLRFQTEDQRSYTGREQQHRLFTPGFLLDPEHPLIHSATTAVENTTGDAPDVRTWTFATDGGYACGIHGIPTLGYAPGEEKYAHTNKERLDLEDARTTLHAYPELIRTLQHTPLPPPDEDFGRAA